MGLGKVVGELLLAGFVLGQTSLKMVPPGVLGQKGVPLVQPQEQQLARAQGQGAAVLKVLLLVGLLLLREAQLLALLLVGLLLELLVMTPAAVLPQVLTVVVTPVGTLVVVGLMELVEG